MPQKVLVVDDSGFFRRRVVEILRSLSDIEVVGTASNGREAIDMAAKLSPDVITMDYEMPVMDGITAVRHIMASNPTPVLMFSSLTYEGARVTFDALEAGAVDFLPKSFEAMSGDAGKIKKLLHDRIIAVSKSRPRHRTKQSASTAAPSFAERGAGSVSGTTPQKSSPLAPEKRAGSLLRSKSAAGSLRSTAAGTSKPGAVSGLTKSPRSATTTDSSAMPSAAASRSAKPKRQEYTLVAIGTSTGGPVALQKVMTQLPANFPRPIVLVQHMPATFTPAFAERLDRLSKIKIKQAEHGEILKPATAYVAPGGKQLLIERSGSQGKLKILEGDERLHYKPCVDVTFGSAAKMFPGRVLGIILTGMGADGREGCRMLKDSNSVVWSQDEASSVIYGMPMAVNKAGLADQIYSLDEFATRITEGVA